MSKWIKCSEQLPEVRLSRTRFGSTIYQSVLVIAFDGRMKSIRRIEWVDLKPPLDGITHWMPVPDDPEA
ncbi:DUF551 domain-containing protein [Metapseudomonas otitidis]|uniref:DUF551 domain-containing protein n=1 Tax=Metapseudomonas otitidis TaxID=319939 RepID=UPI00244B0115|nr:DUF551 domain-containing protein [Pseudomonas otitidis]MDH0335140.1 DUF551 domain-containing protein [Pseudomonas otitidis]